MLYSLEYLRPAIDTLAAAMRRLGTTDFGDEEIGADDIRLIKCSIEIFKVYVEIRYKNTTYKAILYDPQLDE